MSKKNIEPSNIIPIIVAVALMGMFLSPLLPRLVKAIIPFPKLEEVAPLRGTFDYEGEWPAVKVPRYFLVNAEGRHEFRCGYIGARHACYVKPSSFKGQPMTIWRTFEYGVLQIEAKEKDGDQAHPFDVSGRSYADALSNYFNPQYPNVEKLNYLGVVIMLLAILWFATKEVWRRQDLNQQIDSQKFSKSKED